MTKTVAFHEAGHAVIGRAVGFTIGCVTLEVATQPGTASASVHAFRGPDVAPAPGAVVTLTRPLTLRSAIFHLAGPIAEARVSHRSIIGVLNGVPARRDVAAVDAELPDVRDRARALESARLLVLHWWPTICRVAGALLLQRTLDGPALVAVLPPELRSRSPGCVPPELPPELAARIWERWEP